MKRKILMLGTLLVGALIITWTAATPVFSFESEGSKTQAWKGVHLTDAELDMVIGGEPASCMPDAKAEECILRGPEGLTDIIFWDEWRSKGPVRTSEASHGWFGQSNTTGTAQFNSTMAK